jgi:hypothetical protein
MQNKDYVPGADALFNQWQHQLLLYVKPHLSDWNIPEANFTELSSKQQDFTAKYEVYINPETHTPASVTAKQEARKVYEKAIREFVMSHLTYNQAVTNDDRRNMQLTIHDVKPSPAPEITTSPIGEVSLAVHQRHSLRVKDNSLSGKSRPDGARGFETWYKIGAAPAHDNDFIYAGFSSSTRLVIDFPLDQVGQTVYYRFRWVNTRQQVGPWSESLLTAVIP